MAREAWLSVRVLSQQKDLVRALTAPGPRGTSTSFCRGPPSPPPRGLRCARQPPCLGPRLSVPRTAPATQAGHRGESRGDLLGVGPRARASLSPLDSRRTHHSHPTSRLRQGGARRGPQASCSSGKLPAQAGGALTPTPTQLFLESPGSLSLIPPQSRPQSPRPAALPLPPPGWGQLLLC